MHISDDTQAGSSTEPRSPQKLRPWWKRLLLSKLVWSAVLICVAAYFGLAWLQSIGGPVVFRQQYGQRAPILTVPVHVVAAVSPFPSDLIAIANGKLFGLLLGTFYTWLAWWIAAQLQFVLGRQARREMNLEEQTRHLPKWLRNFPVTHPVFMISSRQFPWLGGHVSTLVPAAAGVSYLRHLWCTALAVLPGSVLYAAIGAKLLPW